MNTGRLRRMLHRALEIVLGLVAVSIALLTFWTLVTIMAESRDAGGSIRTLWPITFVLGLGAFALLVFGSRLVVPALRQRGGRVIGRRGMALFGVTYMCLGAWAGMAGTADLAGSVFAIVFGATICFLAYAMPGSDRRSS